jgi:hypothetical protein
MAATMRTLTAFATALWTVACAAAQSPAPAVPAPASGGAESITAADVSRRVHLIAHDSMGGRGTPSPGLEMMAAYVAAEFRRLGLAPGGDSGSYIQRYPLEVYASRPESSSVWATGRAPGRWGLGQAFKFGQGTLTNSHIAAEVVLWTGTPQAGVPLHPASVEGKVVIVAPGPGDLPGAMQLIQAKPAAIVAVLDLPDQVWPQLPDQLQGRQVRKPEETSPLVVPPVLFTRDTTFAPWLAQVGVNVDSVRAAMTGPLTITALSGVELHIALDQRKVESTTAPNVIGILEGSDPVLKGEYVVFSAHIDHVGTAAGGQGCAANGADSICNGADDDGSGSVAVLELAEAFALAPDRPKRSLVFLAVSGEERGLWGSAHWVAHPSVPIASVVANLNNDMVGRSDNFKDSIAVVGREHSDLGATLDGVAAAHPELRMAPVSDPWPQENLFFRSDHFNFARAGVPALFFTSGLHPDYHRVSDTPERIDADYEARYARLVYFLARAIADQPTRPRWDPESYRKIVQQQ